MTRRLVSLGPPEADRTRGLTLIELLVSVAITTVIMLAISSSMLLATKALPDAGSPANAVIIASEIAEQLATELQYAVSIKSRSTNMIEFTVADRDGNEWSKTPGDPLTRQYNGGSAVQVVDRVHEFDLSYDIEAITDEITPDNESSETLLIDYNCVEDLGDYAVQDLAWQGQYFFPSLPGDAISWRVTRVQFFAKTDGAPSGEAKVQLQLPNDAGLPTGIVLEEKTLLESTLLDTYLKQQFTFENVSDLSPQQGLCLVVKRVSGFSACMLQARVRQAFMPNSALLQSSNRGASWLSLVNKSLLYWVYGTVTTAGEPQIENTYYLCGADIRLRANNDQYPTVYTRSILLNRPEVTQ
jgi:prepilin-type N-terminal cleavage/methylation domain-containing protein